MRFLLGGTIMAIAGCIIAGTLWAGDSEAKKPNQGKLRHVVLLKFKDGTTPAQIKTAEDAFRALPAKIPEIAGLEWGTNCSPENLAQGFTHCFFLTFKSTADRAVYLPHPAHKALGTVLGPILEKALVIDYVATE
jgi:hypothetical protein